MALSAAPPRDSRVSARGGAQTAHTIGVQSNNNNTGLSAFIHLPKSYNTVDSDFKDAEEEKKVAAASLHGSSHAHAHGHGGHVQARQRDVLAGEEAAVSLVAVGAAAATAAVIERR